MTIAKAKRFIRYVESGKYTAGKLVLAAVRRHQLDLERGADRGLWFDEGEADAACKVFPLLSHTTGEYAGSPFELRDWQAFVVASMYGWKRADGLRRFREAYVSVGRGNGKSPFAAANAIKQTFLENEAAAAGFCFATTQKQSRVVFDEAVRYVQKSALATVLDIYQGPPNGPSITNKETYAKLEPLTSDGTNADGRVPHTILVDELHEWQEYHRKLWDKIVTSMGKRRQPMLIIITTAGDENSHIWKETLQYSERVLAQAEAPPAEWIGDDHFAFVACIDEDDDIHDERVWPKANPMLLEPNSPVKVEHLRKLSAKAKVDPTAKNQLIRYHLNREVKSTEKPITEKAWAACAGEPPILHDYPCWGGMDLARSRDFASVALVWVLDDGRRFVRAWAFTCENRPELLLSSEFLRVLESPYVEIHPGDQIEFRAIEDRVRWIQEEYGVIGWAYDARFAQEMSQRLRDDHGLTMTAMAQTPATYNEPTRDFLKAIHERRLLHENDPLLSWTAGNLVVRMTPGTELVMPEKDSRLVNKIDPIVAAIMAWREASFGARPMESYYDSHNLEIG